MVKYEIAAVVAEFNYDITQMMLELAKAEAKNRDCEITKVVAVPGVFDMPLVIKKLLQKGEFDAIITLGAVIEGATDHDQIVAQHASRKIADLALEYAYNQVYDLLYPDEGLQDFAMQAVNEHPGYIRGNSDDREEYNGYEDDSDGWDGKIGALTSLYGTSVMGGYCEDTYDDYEGGVWRHAPQYLGIVYSNCGDGGWGDQRHSASVSLNNIAKVFMTAYIEYMDQMDDKYSYDMGSISDATLWDNSDDHMFKIKVGSDVDTGDDNLYANFYDTLFNRICMNGWSENDNVNKIEYMQELLKNGSVYISSINNDGNYYQNSYSTDTYIAEVADTEGIAQAEAKYNAAKARIEHKENTIDMKMKNLDTEISSLTTEYDTMKGLISKVIEKSFKRYEA